jgi:hypothetical protein
MRKANCKAVFTCKPLLGPCQTAFTAINGDSSNVFLLELPLPEEPPVPASNRTISQLIADGENLPDLQPLNLQGFDSKDRLAYLCPTSGTSGFLVCTYNLTYGFSGNGLILGRRKLRRYLMRT